MKYYCQGYLAAEKSKATLLKDIFLSFPQSPNLPKEAYRAWMQGAVDSALDRFYAERRKSPKIEMF